jgi:hypothetical protein
MFDDGNDTEVRRSDCMICIDPCVQPARDAQPTLYYDVSSGTDDSAWPYHTQMMESFPFNKYAVEPCEVTEYLSTHRGVRWKVYVRIEQPNEHEGNRYRYAAFGFLQATAAGASARRSVHLFVLPFDFPRLWPLLGTKHSRPSQR